MKRFVLVFVGVLFVLLTGFLSGCEIASDSVDANATNVFASVTALFSIPTSTVTPIPRGKPLIDELNTILESGKVVDDLTKAVDAHYQVMDIRFQPFDSAVTFVDMDMLCVCVHSKCCSPEQAFVAHAMKAMGKKFVDNIPDTTLEVHINFRNSNSVTGYANVIWGDLKRYIIESNDAINAYQLGNGLNIQYQP
jgi:hypothetical protein